MPGIKVLIIDTNNNFSRAAQNFLLSRCEVNAVETVTTADEALHAAESFSPDLFLLDALLIDQNGFKAGLLKLLKEKRSQAKMVLMTLYPPHDGFYDQPGYELLSERVSKQDFAKEFLPLLKGHFKGHGRSD